MALKPFHELWMLANLRKIRRDFCDKEDIFICFASNLFSDLWYNYHKEIIKLAIKFDPSEAPFQKKQTSFESVLFHRDWKKGRDFDPRKKRLAFLDHEIKRLTPKRNATKSL